MSVKYDQIILFGDSITQAGFSQQLGFAFAAQLSDDYIRKLDVINRGFSGFNTDQALRVLSQVIPPPSETKVRLLTIFLGANDACLPDAPSQQHVPLDRFAANIKSLVTHPVVTAQAPKIIIITPPPVNEYPMNAFENAVGGTLSRTAEHTRLYVDAAKKAGQETGTKVLDIWTPMMIKAGWKPEDHLLPGSLKLPQNAILQELLFDGLHLAPAGYRILHEELTKLIRSEWPALEPEKLPFLLPRWDNRAAWSGQLSWE